MVSVSSEDNLGLFLKITTKVLAAIEMNGESTITSIIGGYDGNPDVSEKEIRGAIEWGVNNSYLTLNVKRPYYNSIVGMGAVQPPNSLKGGYQLVISIPEMMELGFSRVALRNDMIETRSAFKSVLTNAKRTLRISSPFFESTILDSGGMPDIKDYFSFAFERGCHVIILSRYTSSRLTKNFGWLCDLVKANNYADQLTLFEYHHEDGHGKVFSSTHTKMLISDSSLAYVGSAEIRRGSLANNFEVGCLIDGPAVSGLCEAFDLMLKYSNEVRF
jgi:phosphatidylserine/phosphatidylglycerophosphate/cardiolipin synthase-like enzyme